jgi:hypothetical protein
MSSEKPHVPESGFEWGKGGKDNVQWNEVNQNTGRSISKAVWTYYVFITEIYGSRV